MFLFGSKIYCMMILFDVNDFVAFDERNVDWKNIVLWT